MELKQNTKESFFKLLFLEPKLLLFGLLSLALGSAINLLIPELVRRYLNNNFATSLSNNYYNLALVLIAIFALQGLCFYFRSYSFNLLGHKIAYRLRADTFKNLLSKSISFFDSTNSAGLSSRIINDTQVIQDIFSLRISVLIRYGFQVIAGAILMFIISPKLAFLILLVIPILVVFGYALGKKLKSCSKTLQEALGNSTNLINEVYASIKVIYSFGNSNIEINRFNKLNQDTLIAGIQRSKVSSFFSSFISFLMNLAIIIFFFYGLSLVNNNALSYGDLTAFLLYGAIVAVSFSFAISSYSDVLQGIGALSRINELNIPDNKKASIEFVTPEKAFSSIQFSKVSYSYDSREKQLALKDINLKISANSFVALVGSSGSGKSTLANLLLGFYQPTIGEISYDNINLSHISKDWLYNMTQKL
jgi:ABC-type multidrug transport system fused ATPase/permease subunit